MRFAVPVYGVRLADVSQLMCTRNSASLSACNGFPSQTEFIPQPSMAVCLASIDCVPSLTVSQSQSPPVDPMLSPTPESLTQSPPLIIYSVTSNFLLNSCSIHTKLDKRHLAHHDTIF